MKKNILHRMFSFPFRFTKKSFKFLKLRIKHKLGILGRPVMIAYRGFTNGKEIFVSGLVTEDIGLEKPQANRSRWNNAVAMLKRYMGDEFPDIELEVSLGGKVLEAVTDENGFFSIVGNFEIPTEGPQKQWLSYETRAAIADESREYQLHATGEMLSPVASTRFGVVSDIDDTIIVSHSTRATKKLYLMLSRNSRTRKPFPGAASFYRALHEGKAGNERNPFFYVSSSEWNLYDLLDDFCRYNGFPKGVFMLRDWVKSLGNFRKSGGGTHEQKLENIRRIFNAFPGLPFVLIGDNGQRDPEIYKTIAEEFPGRVLVIYIRSVRKRNQRHVEETARTLGKLGIDLLSVKDSYEASQDAGARGLIQVNKEREIREEKELDE